ncbi:MAG: hypothetical protein Q9166_005112 [cf. Caloplaca sp. 2 TL-2023]
MNNSHEAAPALLGSTLLANEEKLGTSRPRPVSSGNKAIDTQALEGGFRYGEIASIAGASGTGKTLLVFQAIASLLIAHDKGEVALIATIDPPLARLRDILVSRLVRHDQGPECEESGYVYRKQSSVVHPPEDLQSRVASMLDRVRLSRVFDFPGVAEAIGEIGARLDETERIRDAENNANHQSREQSRERSIADSEDEVESSSLPDADASATENTTTAKDQLEAPLSLPASMIVIDSIANVVGSMMAKSQVQGHAMLASCMRSLQHLTRRCNACTLVVNAAVSLRFQSPQYHRKADDHVSVFASTLGKPALGKHFSYLVDTSIFLSTLPRSKDDTDIAYNDRHEERDFAEVGVIEVLKDRHGGREGRWSAFTIDMGVELQSVQLRA